MVCPNFEDRLLMDAEGLLTPIESETVRAHLRECAGCRSYAERAQKLDGALARHLAVSVLPEDFVLRLRDRIDQEKLLSEADRLERKRQLQAEFNASLRRLRLAPSIVRQLAVGAAVGLILGSACLGISWETLLPGWQLPPLATPVLRVDWLVPILTVSSVFLLSGLRSAFPEAFRALLE